MRMKMRDYGWKWSSPHRLTAVLQINPRNLEGKTSFIADTLEQRFIRTAATPAGKRFLNAVSWGAVGCGGVRWRGGSQVVCLDDFPRACDNVGPSLSVCTREGGGGWQLYPGRSHQCHPPTTTNPPTPRRTGAKRKIPPTPNTVAG